MANFSQRSNKLFWKIRSSSPTYLWIRCSPCLSFHAHKHFNTHPFTFHLICMWGIFQCGAFAYVEYLPMWAICHCEEFAYRCGVFANVGHLQTWGICQCEVYSNVGYLPMFIFANVGYLPMFCICPCICGGQPVGLLRPQRRLQSALSASLADTSLRHKAADNPADRFNSLQAKRQKD